MILIIKHYNLSFFVIVSLYAYLEYELTTVTIVF